MRANLFLVLIIIAGVSLAGDVTPGDKDGQVYRLSDSAFLAWDAGRGRWVEPEAFWDSYQERAAGKRWPSDSKFPPYKEVSEHDTMLLQTDKGPCLMYFFHTRWRRANDVWRWGEEFNKYAGCPYVFD